MPWGRRQSEQSQAKEVIDQSYLFSFTSRGHAETAPCA